MAQRLSSRLKQRRNKETEKRLSVNSFIRAVVLIRHEQEENLPPHTKLVDDCWEYIFDLLPVADILKLAKTSKRMQELCGAYLSEYFPNINYSFLGEKVCCQYPSSITINKEFYQYISTMVVSSPYINRFDARTGTFFRNIENFAGLKTIKLINNNATTREDINKIRKALNVIETLMIRCVYFHENCFDQFAYHCLNLKSLCISNCNFANEVFTHHFPALEHFSFSSLYEIKEEFGLCSFLNKHKNLKHFECDWKFLWCNEQQFERTITQIDQITLRFSGNLGTKRISLDGLFINLRWLYQEIFFKWLNVSIDILYDERKLFAQDLADLCKTIPIKTLNLFDIGGVSSLFCAKEITTLEKVFIAHPNNIEISFYILHAQNLKSLKIGPSSRVYFGPNKIENLEIIKLNGERKRNLNARRIFFYLTDVEYFKLRKKVSFDLSHIIIKRYE